MIKLFELLVVLMLSAVALWSAIPVGLAAGFTPLTILWVSLFGNISSVTGVTYAGECVHRWILDHFGRRAIRRTNSTLWRIWERYGVVGLSLVSPWILGAPVAAAFGVALGIPTRRMLTWMLPSSILRVITFTAGMSLGWFGFERYVIN